MKYFLRVIYRHQDKNQAQKATSEFIAQFDKVLIKNRASLDKLIKTINDKITEINKANPRCTDIKVDYNEWDSGSITMYYPSIGLGATGVKEEIDLENYSNPDLKLEGKDHHKSVLKLDNNFHIYIHGDRTRIEEGCTEKGKYLKLYYDKAR